jgi:DNA-binding NarL/FixJ family response regulator
MTGGIPLKPVEIRALVTDDSSNLLQTITAFLKTLPGVTVVGATQSPKECLQLAQEQRPDLILTDIRMPGMTGLELAAQLLKVVPDCAVIVMSAFDQDEIQQAFHESGALAFVPKDRLMDQLPKIVQEISKKKVKG